MGINDYPKEIVDLAKEVVADSKVSMSSEEDRIAAVLDTAASIQELRQGRREEASGYIVY